MDERAIVPFAVRILHVTRRIILLSGYSDNNICSEHLGCRASEQHDICNTGDNLKDQYAPRRGKATEFNDPRLPAYIHDVTSRQGGWH